MSSTADTAEPAAAAEPINTKCTDSVFLMECLKNLNAPASVDINAVAKALGYGNPNSAANRARALKKRFNLQINAVSGSGAVNGAPAIEDGTPGTPKSTPASPKTPRKGAKATRGPAKAKPEPADGDDSTPATTPAKRGRKPGSGAGRKRKTTAAASDVKTEVAGAAKGPDADENSAGSPVTAEPQNTQATEKADEDGNADTA